jgi:hypothetical protein
VHFGWFSPGPKRKKKTIKQAEAGERDIDVTKKLSLK